MYRLEGRRRTRVGSGDQRKEGPGHWIPDIRTKEMCGTIRDPGTEKPTTKNVAKYHMMGTFLYFRGSLISSDSNVHVYHVCNNLRLVSCKKIKKVDITFATDDTN